MKANNNIYLHIGWPKTATTTIQDGLTANSSHLKDIGYLYPKSGRRGNAHHNLAYQVQDHYRYLFNKSVGTFEDIVDEIEKSDEMNIIISSEALNNSTPDQIQKVFKYLSPLGKIKIILYLRRPDVWINSHWAQQVKVGAIVDTPDEYVDRVLKTRDYEKILNWTKNFNQENIIIRIFEKEQLDNEHIFHDFLKTCDIKNYKNIPIPESTNISPSIKELEIIRYFYSHIDNRLKIPTDTRYRMFFAFQEFGKRMGWSKEQKSNIVSAALYKKIMGHYYPSTKKIAQTFFSRDDLFLEPYVEREVTNYDVSKFDGKEAVELFAFMCVQILKFTSKDKKNIDGEHSIIHKEY